MNDHTQPALTAGPLGADDRYSLHEVISSGMEGRLWRASLKVDGHTFQVAVKEIHAQNLVDLDEWVRRWERQAELLRSLDHPHLVRVREVFRGAAAHRPGDPVADQRSLFLVMNWANGNHLGHWMQGRGLQDRLAVLAKVAAAVDHLHSGRDTNGVAVMHRDLKPANIIVDDSGNPRIVDFGFARLADGDEYTVVGSPHFMAPEIPLGAAPTPASDRYSFGCIAYTSLVGHRVRPNETEVVQAHLVELRDAGVPDLLVDELRSLLDTDPRRRPRDLSAWHGEPTTRTVAHQDRRDRHGVPVVGPGSAMQDAGHDAVSVHDPLPPNPPSLPVYPAVTSSWPLHHGGSYPPSGYVSASYPSSIIQVAAPRRTGWVVPVIAGLLAVVVVGGALVLYAANRSDEVAAVSTTTTAVAPPTVRVPDLMSRPSAEARAELERLGFTVGADVEDATSSGPAGTVLRLDPPTGAELEQGAEVRLVVAGTSFRMPGLSGTTLDDAREQLSRLGHQPDQVSVVPAGSHGDQRIVVQRPAPGVATDKTGTVELTVETTTTTTTTTAPPPDFAPVEPEIAPRGPVLPPPTVAPQR